MLLSFCGNLKKIMLFCGVRREKELLGCGVFVPITFQRRRIKGTLSKKEGKAVFSKFVTLIISKYSPVQAL